MKRSPLVLGTALVLSGFAAFAVSDGEGVGSANGSPNIQGMWEGKFRFRLVDLSGATADQQETCDVTLDITQSGKDLSGTITVSCAGAPDLVFPIDDGEVGNDQFWVESQPLSPDADLVLTARVRGNGTKMKGIGVVVFENPDQVAEAKFNA